MHLKHWTKSTTPEKLAKISDKFLLVMINRYHMDMVDKTKTRGERLIAERRARIFRHEFWRRRPLSKLVRD